MTVAYGTYNSAQANTVIVPAQEGKIIRVVKIVVSTFAGVKVTFLSDPGLDPVVLTPPLHASMAGLHLHLGRSCALATGRGKALGFNASYQMASGEYSVTVWYEVMS
jgi:hypothetical protein